MLTAKDTSKFGIMAALAGSLLILLVASPAMVIEAAPISSRLSSSGMNA